MSTISAPVHAAETALARNLAYKLDDPRYLKMREEARKTGWPHLIDAQKAYDLDRDPNTVAVFSSAGKKLRDEQPEQTFTRIDRGPPRQVFVTRPPEPEQF